MSREVYEGNTKVYWLTSCSNIAAPTTGEIAAGKYLGQFITKDGVALNVSQNAVDTAGIDSVWDTQVGGSVGMTPEITMFRDSGSEVNGWDLVVAGAEGFLLISPFGVPTTGSKVEVIPAEMGIAKPANSAANEAQKFSAAFFMRLQPNLRAVVA